MIYKDLLINKKVTNQLVNFYKNNKIQNAYIFYGQEGVGKEAHAIEFFAMINCENNLEDYSACRKCNSCLKVLSLQHELLNITLPMPRHKTMKKNDSPLKGLNEKQINDYTNQLKLKGQKPYFKIKLDNANTILINSIKEIKKSIQLSIQHNKYKLHLILDAEKLCYPKAEPANALLKILEEPSENNFFILVVSDISKILDTIKSRCTTIFFNPIQVEDNYKYLLNNNIDDQNAKIISELSFGNISHSLEISNNFDEKMSKLYKLIQSLFDNDLAKWKKEFSLIKEKNKIFEILNFILLFLRDVHAFKLSNNNNSIVFNNYENDIIKISKTYSFDISKCYNTINKTINNINANGYPPLMITGLFFELNYLLNNKTNLLKVS